MMMLFSRRGKSRNKKAVVVAGQQHEATSSRNNKRRARGAGNNNSLLKKDQSSSSARSVASTVSAESSSSSIANSSLHRCGPLNPTTSGPVSPHQQQSSSSSSSSSSSRVRFNPSLKIRETLHVRDYTPTEIASCWYDKFESDEIVNEAKFVIRLYDEISDDLIILDENKYPQRGLEFLYMKHHHHHQNNNNSSSKKKNGNDKKNGDNNNNTNNNNNNSTTTTTAKLSRQAVFDEQTKLKSGVKKLDPFKIQSRIQSVYTIYTQGSRMQARLLALSDELAVK